MSGRKLLDPTTYVTCSFGAFAKLWIATTSLLMSVRMEKSDSHWTYFLWNLLLNVFWKTVEKIQDPSSKRNKNKAYFERRPIHIFDHISPIFFRMRNVSDKICTENQNTHFVFSNFFFFRKSCCLWDNVEKCCRAGQATDGNMVHVHCMLDT